jgi:hypothetical protein
MSNENEELTQLNIRNVSKDVTDRLDDVMTRMRAKDQGVAYSRQDIMRRAMILGLEVMEKDLALVSK